MGNKEFFKYLDKHSNERIRMKITVKDGKVGDIVVQYETLIEGKWNVIVRYDCAHGYFHRDVLFPNGEKKSKWLNLVILKQHYLMRNKI